MRHDRFPLSTLLLLGACSTIAPLALNMHVPALGELAASLDIDRADASLTVTAYLWVFGTGMLFAGIPADRFGRRPTLIAGLALFSIGALVAGSVEWTSIMSMFKAEPPQNNGLPPRYQLLLAARGLQALGASLIVVIPRTMVNDRTRGKRAVQLLGALATIMAAAPALAPIAGAALALSLGWETIFLAQMGLGVGLVGVCLWALPETRPEPIASRAEAMQKAENPEKPLSAHAQEEPTDRPMIEEESERVRPVHVVVAPVLIMSLLMAVYYAYLGGGADAALVHFDKTSAQLAILLATLSAVYVIGNLLVVRFATVFAPSMWVRVGVLLCAASIPAVYLAPTYALTGAGMCIYALGVGMVMPTSLAIAGNVRPHLRAHVMSVSSSSPFLLGGALSLLANLFEITTWTRFEGMMAASVAACIVLAILMRDHTVDVAVDA